MFSCPGPNEIIIRGSWNVLQLSAQNDFLVLALAVWAWKLLQLFTDRLSKPDKWSTTPNTPRGKHIFWEDRNMFIRTGHRVSFQFMDSFSSFGFTVVMLTSSQYYENRHYFHDCRSLFKPLTWSLTFILLVWMRPFNYPQWTEGFIHF